MLGLIHNELIKYRKKKKFIIVTLAIALLTALVIYSYNRSVNNFNKYNGIDFKISQAKEEIESLKKQKDDNEIPMDVRSSMPKAIENLQKELDMLQKEKNVGKKDYKEVLNEDIKSLENEKKDIKEKQSGEGRVSELEYINRLIKIDKYLLENKIEPNADEYQRMNRRGQYRGMVDEEVTGFGFLMQELSVFGIFFLAVIIAVHVSDCVSGEYTPATIKVLLTKPVSRGKILFSKFIASIISISSIIMSIEIFCFLLIGTIFKFGNPLYPVAVGTKYKLGNIINESGVKNILPIENSTQIIPQWKYFMEMMLFQLLFIIACVSVFFLISTILKSSMASSTLSVVLVVGLFIISNMGIFRKISAFFFTSYGNPMMIEDVSNSLVQRYHVPFISFSFAVGLMLVYIVVSYLIAHFVFKKKDMLM